MQRFFVPPRVLQEETILLTGAQARQVNQVLRMRPGQHIILLDGSGWAYEIALDSVDTKRVCGHLIARSQPDTEPRVRLVLYQALIREQKLDWVLQKGTEVGVSAFAPLVTQRSLVQRCEDITEGKLARWQRIVTEAAEQSGRVCLPRMLPASDLPRAFGPALPGVMRLIAWMGQGAQPLAELLREMGGFRPVEIQLFVGPEGDFTVEEAALAQRSGIVPISLGPRTLRAETAALVASTLILHAAGGFD